MSLIYCVEDDLGISELISCALKTGGYEIATFHNSNDFYNELSNAIPDLILLDLMLPGDDGFTILKKLKKDSKYEDIPVIILTAKTSEIDKVTALEGGADDYITKPFGVLELLSRIKAVLRRTHKSNPKTNSISCRGLTIDTLKRTVEYNSSQISLTYKEFELLSYLMQNINIVISRDKLMDRVWGYNNCEVETRTLDMHIKTLRRKLDDVGCTDYIQTVRGVGFKITE